MAQVIEHRTPEGVLSAFENSGCNKLAIWHGTIPIMVYDGDDNTEAGNRLLDWLQQIQDNGTTAVYMLKVYPDTTKEITNKTAYRAATRFQLNEAAGANYTNSPDGKVIMIRDANRQAVGNTNSGNNAQLQMLIDQNKQMMDMMLQQMKQQQETKIDKLIGFLEEKERTPPAETWETRLMKLGELLVEKPDIIDRVGYIFRPDAYQRIDYNEPAAQPIAGTQQKEPPPPPQSTTTNKEEPMEDEVQEPLTEEQEAAITERQNIALDKLEEVLGLEEITAILETLAAHNPDKLQKLTVDKLKSALNFL